MSILEATQIRKSYQTAKQPLLILKSVDVTIEQGEIVALVGPSGCGKSTLLNILGVLDQPDQGSLQIMGQDVRTMSDKPLAQFRCNQIGFVFQFHHLLPELTLWENIALPVWLKTGKRDSDLTYVNKLIEQTGLADRRDHYPYQLSGGERQRAAVIRALVNRPGIVFADEPTGNLDRENGQMLMDLIVELRKENGQTFFLATHDEKMAAVADRVILLKDGEVNVT